MNERSNIQAIPTPALYQSSGTAIPFNGLKGWWIGDNIPGVVNGDVAVWYDASGNANKLELSDIATSSPIINDTAFGAGKRCVAFTTAEFQCLVSANVFGAGTVCSVFGVYRVNGNGVFGVFGQGTSPGPNNTTLVLQSRNAPTSKDPYFSTFLGDIPGTSGQTGVARLSGFTLNGTTVTLYNKAAVEASGTLVLNTGTSPFRVGGTFDDQENFEGWIAEVIAYNRVLTGPEITQVTNYLIGRYSIP